MLKLLRRRVASLIYSLFSSFHRKSEIVLIFSKHSDSFNNLPVIAEALYKEKIPFHIIDSKLTIYNIFRVSRAKVVCLDQSTPLTSNIKLSGATEVIQVWHAGGAFKKFGYDASDGTAADENRILRIHGNTKWIITSSKKICQIYSNAFKLPLQRVLPLGIPRTDKYFQVSIPDVKEQKIVLYAPTFRVDRHKNKRYVNNVRATVRTLKKFLEEKGYRIAIRLHPSVSTNFVMPDVIDWSSKPLLEVLTKTDVLITDFSSIIFDYSLFNGRIFWYLEELSKYEKERGFYFNPLIEYPEYSSQEIGVLCNLIVDNEVENCLTIRNQFMDACDGLSTSRVVKLVKSFL